MNGNAVKTNMTYNEALNRLSAVMKEREDISAVTFDREYDCFDVISYDGSKHVCCGDEFRGGKLKRTQNINDKNMKYTTAVILLFEIMEGREDIVHVTFNREKDSLDIINVDETHISVPKEFKGGKEESMRQIVNNNEGLNIVLNEIVNYELNKTLDEMIKAVEEWKANCDVISCEAVIKMLKARQTE